jgi:hypothetical protein
MKYIVGLPFDFEDFTIEKLDALTDEEKFLIADTNSSAVMYNSTKDYLQALNGDYVDTENLVWYEIEVNVTPNELFGNFREIGDIARLGIAKLMQKHNVSTLNTKIYMDEYGFDYTDISVYDRKMDGMFFEPISFIQLENDTPRLFYDGETSGEYYDSLTTDWLNVYSLVYDIFNEVDKNNVELYTEKEYDN